MFDAADIVEADGVVKAVEGAEIFEAVGLIEAIEALDDIEFDVLVNTIKSRTAILRRITGYEGVFGTLVRYEP